MRLAVLLALTSVAHAEPPKGSWTLDVAVGGGIRRVSNGTTSTTQSVGELRIGTGHMFTDRIGFEMQFDQLVLRDGSFLEGAITMTIGCQFWPADHWFATLGAGISGKQRADLTYSGGEDGNAVLATGGYAIPIGIGSMLTLGVGASHTMGSNVPSAVTATIGFLSL